MLLVDVDAGLGPARRGSSGRLPSLPPVVVGGNVGEPVWFHAILRAERLNAWARRSGRPSHPGPQGSNPEDPDAYSVGRLAPGECMSGDRYNSPQVPSWAIPGGGDIFRQHRVPDRRHHGVQGDGTARHAGMRRPRTALRPVSRRGGLEARAGGCWHCASSISPASAPTRYPYNQRQRKSVPPVLARLPLRYAHSEAGQTDHLSLAVADRPTLLSRGSPIATVQPRLFP
jgi:hypothetical protein